MEIKDKAYFDFTGGVVRNKSPMTLSDNELQLGRNVVVDEKGRITRRLGCRQFGQDIASFPTRMHSDANGTLVANGASTAVVYKLQNSFLTGAITTASTSFTISSAAGFTDPGGGSTAYVEIDGDIIGYTDISTNTFTTVTGISENHASGSPVHQWVTVGTLTGSDGDDGTGFTYLNSLTIIKSLGANYKFDGTTLTQFSMPTTMNTGYMLETFRDRVYTVVGGTVYFSNLGDGTSWPTTAADNSFILEDRTGESISVIKQHKANLLIFKPSSFYSFSGSLPVHQISADFGVYNDTCVQEIGESLYCFGPAGVFITDGSSIKDIGQPVTEYLKELNNTPLAGTGALTNAVTGSDGINFFIYLGDITNPKTISDVTLAYSTLTGKWTVYDSWDDLTMMKYLKSFYVGGTRQYRDTGFWGKNTKVYRMFDDTSIVNSVKRGELLLIDKESDATGSNITFSVLTKPYGLDFPNIRKQFGYLKVYSELPQGAHISVVIDDKDPIPLGQITKQIQRFQFPSSAKGYCCAIQIDESSQVKPLVINGFIFEDCAEISK